MHTDGAGNAGDLIYRRQRPPADPISAQAGTQQNSGDHQEQKSAQRTHDLSRFIERGGYSRIVSHPSMSDLTGEQADRPAAVHQSLEGGLAR